jgi:hypothetical protein
MDALPVIRCIRAPFSMTRPWTTPPGVERVLLRRAEDGTPLRLKSYAGCYRDDERLFILFEMEDEPSVHATMRERDAELWREDVVEIFIAPENDTRYFEVEVSPRGTLFDALISSPDRQRATMVTDRDWSCAGLSALIRRERTARSHLVQMHVLVVIPFAGLSRENPAKGEEWRVNFYRIDRGSSGDEFAAWSPTFADPPDFHLPARFGILRFE